MRPLSDRPKATLIDLQAAIDPSSPQFNQAISEMIERNRPKRIVLSTSTLDKDSEKLMADIKRFIDSDDEYDRAEDV